MPVGESLLPEPSYFKVKIATEKLSDQIPAELIQAGGNTLRADFHKLINCVWDKEEMAQQWKESIIVPLYMYGDKTGCSNYRGISLLTTAHKILSNILVSKAGYFLTSSVTISLSNNALHHEVSR
jgi:hypothetical protein